MERHHRDLLTAIAAIMLCLLVLLGWGLLSRARQSPPMVVAGAAPGSAGASAMPDSAPRGTAAAPADTAAHPAPSPASVRVHIVGAVRKPAVYTLPGDARVDDAVKKAGGATADADLERINLADFLKDGEQVRIPRKGEHALAPLVTAPSSAPGEKGATRRAASAAPALPNHGTGRYPAAGAANGSAGAGTPPAHPASRKKSSTGSAVNLNTASAAELEDLPGVGPATAAKIIEYRQEHGRFLRVEDIMEVRGIGQKKFEKMKERLTVR